MHLQNKHLALALFAALGLSASAIAGDTTMEGDMAMAAEMAMPSEAKYKVVFTPAWTKANFPHEYPESSMFHKPHFSGWIGTAHNDGYTIFRDGVRPTPGLEVLSEMGKHSPLDAEIKAAIAKGNARGLAESGPLKDFSQTASFEITVDDAHPMAAAVAMIAPSPDWFAAIDVKLKENGAWVGSKTVQVLAWDSGGDTGTTYLASDAEAKPKQPSMLAGNKHFTKGGKSLPVGSITFTRL